MDTATGFEFIISDADPPWWLETGVLYSVNGLQYHTTIYSPWRIIWQFQGDQPVNQENPFVYDC